MAEKLIGEVAVHAPEDLSAVQHCLSGNPLINMRDEIRRFTGVWKIIESVP